MKRITSFTGIFSALILSVSLNSCSIQKRVYKNGWHITWHLTKNKKTYIAELSEKETTSQDTVLTVVPPETMDVFVSSDNAIQPETLTKKAVTKIEKEIPRNKIAQPIENYKDTTYPKPETSERPHSAGKFFIFAGLAMSISGGIMLNSTDDLLIVLGFFIFLFGTSFIILGNIFVAIFRKWKSLNPYSEYILTKDRKFLERKRSIFWILFGASLLCILGAMIPASIGFVFVNSYFFTLLIVAGVLLWILAFLSFALFQAKKKRIEKKLQEIDKS